MRCQRRCFRASRLPRLLPFLLLLLQASPVLILTQVSHMLVLLLRVCPTLLLL